VFKTTTVFGLAADTAFDESVLAEGQGEAGAVGALHLHVVGEDDRGIGVLGGLSGVGVGVGARRLPAEPDPVAAGAVEVEHRHVVGLPGGELMVPVRVRTRWAPLLSTTCWPPTDSVLPSSLVSENV
jgi:hypothetical protein